MTASDLITQHIDQVNRMITAGNIGDRAGLAACYAQDLTYHEFAMERTYHGPAELLEVVEGWWATSKDIYTEAHKIFATETAAAVEWTMSGTIIGAMPGLPATKAAGKKYSFPGAFMMEFSAATGQISRQTDYWNLGTFLAQIGIDSISELWVR